MNLAKLHSDPNSLVRQALNACSAGHLDEAILFALSFCQRFAIRYYEAYVLAISVLQKAGYHEIALEYCDKAVDRYPDNTDLLERALRTAWEAGDEQRATNYISMMRHLFLRHPSPALLQEMVRRNICLKGACGIHNGHLHGWLWLVKGEKLHMTATQGAPSLKPGALRPITVGTHQLYELDMALPTHTSWYGLTVTVNGVPLPGSPVICSPAEAARYTGAKHQLQGVTIVVPCYDGYTATLSCLASVLASGRHNTTPTRVLAVWDHGADKHLLEALQRLAARKKLILVKTLSNLGFIGTVNYALSAIPDGDVILLTADTLVHGDWIDRLVAVGKLPDAGTVTPLGSDADLCSFPSYWNRGDVRRLRDVARLDNACRHLPQKMWIQEIPVGAAFCMLIPRRAIQRLGGFDGLHLHRGYGEDKDFCLRCTEAHLKNYMACHVYVGHRSKQSFKVVSRVLEAQNAKVLSARHVSYDSSYSQFLQEAPLQVVQEHISRLTCQSDVDTVLDIRAWGEQYIKVKKQEHGQTCFAVACDGGLRVLLRVYQGITLSDMSFFLPDDADVLRHLITQCKCRVILMHGKLSWANCLAETLNLPVRPAHDDRAELPTLDLLPGRNAIFVPPLSLQTWQSSCHSIHNMASMTFFSPALEKVWGTAPHPQNWDSLPHMENLQPLRPVALVFAENPEFDRQQRWHSWLRDYHVETLPMVKLPVCVP